MLRSVGLLGLAAALAGIVFASFGGIDLAASALFYVDAGFPFRSSPTAAWLRASIPALVWLVVVASILPPLLGLVRRRPVGALGLRPAAFVILSLAVGPGLVANGILKSYSGRPRPIDVVQFGGSQEFRAAWDFGGACRTDCSFVSGEASVGFCLVAPALLLRRHRRAAVIGAAFAGAAIGVGRVASGAHFVSDIVFAGFVTIMVVLMLRWLILERPRPRGAPEPG